MCLRRSTRGGHVFCRRGLGTERKCGSHHAAWSPGRIRCKSEGEVVSAIEVEGEAVFAEKRGRIRAWPSGTTGLHLCPVVITRGVNNPASPGTRANAGSRRVGRYPAQLVASCVIARARLHLRALASAAARGHVPQHFIRYQRLARDQVAGARQVFQTHAQRIVQGDSGAPRSDGARIDAHHARGVAQSRPHRARRVALKQFHRYFVQNEVLQRSERVARPDPRRRHDSCLWSG
jgi:hypothetical protein